MATSKITKGYHCIVDDFTITDGYVKYVSVYVKTTSKVFVTIVRSDSTDLWSPYAAYPKINRDGELTIFIRNTTTGNMPSQNVTIRLSIMIA